MPAYIVVHMTPKDQEALLTYSQSALPTIEKHGGRFLTKGPHSSLHGNNTFNTSAVIQFPDHDLARTWYESAEYQALIPLRNKAMDSEFSLIQA